MSKQHPVNIASLPQLLSELGEVEQKEVEQIFRIEELVGLNEVPDALRAKVARWCGSTDPNENMDAPTAAWRRAARQITVSVTNIWTFETASFNTLRACRPLQGNASSAGPDEVCSSNEGPDLCDFCDLDNMTCTEPQLETNGRIRGNYSATAGNVFKTAGYHGLVIWNGHYPHRLTTDEVVDGFEVADKWFSKSLASDLSEKGRVTYPIMFWNTFRSAGASQIHPHMQMQLFSAPVAQGLLFREQFGQYRQKFGEDADLIHDIIRAHTHLGLASKAGKTRCWASLTPRVGGGEFSILGPSEGGAGDLPKLASVAHAVAAVLRTLRRCGMEGISVGAFPVPTVSKSEGRSVQNAWLVRVFGRGKVIESCTDAASAELVGLAGIAMDPFRLSETLREELQEFEG